MVSEAALVSAGASRDVNTLYFAITFHYFVN